MVFGLCFICNQRDCQLDSLHPYQKMADFFGENFGNDFGFRCINEIDGYKKKSGTP